MNGLHLATVLGAGALIWALWPRRRRVGAWGLMSSLDNPIGVLAKLQRYGITAIDVMVNDHPGQTGAWKCRPWAQIEAAARVWQAAGIEVSITSWIRPAPDWIAGLADLNGRCRAAGIRLNLDMEDPWYVPLLGMSQTQRDATTDAAFDSIGPDVGATFIVYTHAGVIGPILRRAARRIPQCYATGPDPLDPVKHPGNATKRAPGELERITVQKFGRDIILGMVGWNEEGAYGLPKMAALRASLDEARKLGIREVRVWRLDAIDADEAAALAAWTR